MLFDSGLNFYGGPGESAHKQFIKIPGQRTQRRVSEFAQQTALQYYNMLLSSIAYNECIFETNNWKQYGCGDDNSLDNICKKGDISIGLIGKFTFVVTDELLQMMDTQRKLG